MKKFTIVVALAVVLVLAFAATAFATSPKTWSYAADYYYWDLGAGDGNGVLLGTVGANPANPGVHANYMANTAKCGICHSVHRAVADGVKLLETGDATCAGCHRAGTGVVTTRLVSWEPGGPHGSGANTQCTNRVCHVNSPHGVGVSEYKLLGGKLINGDSGARGVDKVIDAALAIGTDAERGWNATDLNNTVGDFALTDGEKSALISGYTCNQSDCHGNTMLPVIAKGWAESRGTLYPNDNFMVQDPSLNSMKTGHIAGSAEATATHASYTPIDGCTSCHDQTDAATTSGFTFPHSQTAYGATNLAGRAYLWMGYAAQKGDPLTAVGQGDKAFDGTCLKCHRDTDGSGIGVTH